jgi:hypothetical protein
MSSSRFVTRGVGIIDVDEEGWKIQGKKTRHHGMI